MLGELQRIATQCDGVRCDMAMLVLPDVFEPHLGDRCRSRSGRVPRPPCATRTPGFTFMAEVYWDLEWTLQQQGFDYTYDKRLYDRLREGRARPVREHLCAGLDYQDHLARFLENHDEPRAAATFEPDKHRAAAVVTFLAPGLRFFHQGEREGRDGRTSRCTSAGGRPRARTPSWRCSTTAAGVPRPARVPRRASGSLLEARPAWDGNATNDDFICYSWTGPADERRLVAVNYSAHQSQCHVRCRGPTWAAGSGVSTTRSATSSTSATAQSSLQRGLYLDLPAVGLPRLRAAPRRAPAL